MAGLFGLPIGPLSGTIKLAEVIQREAESQYYDPGEIRRALEDVAEARRSGELSDVEADRMERALVRRLREAGRRRSD